ncbi:DUF2800 domain-containing protein [Methylibium sp.]|uniref:DUF2800 domain-containing protein n=1 Tax=Methylibium sp. TaxID=2067992 RepID=UPI00181E51ED|nr:DUF2800 domain-containing protein [Methylibium sp.]MBA3588502.1 DUF2800 domain-containing protein [Methylibium sp.]
MNQLAHSPLGASNAKRWMACPGSVAACASLPPSQSSPDSLLGTAAHALAEWCLVNEKSAASQIGNTFEDHTVDEAMAEAVQVYLDTVRDWQAQMPGALLSVEVRVDLSWLHPDMFGTADAMIVQPWGEAVVIDYKNGMNAVEVDGPQMPYYGLGAYNAHDCTHVTCVIVQPNAPHRDGPVRSITYAREQMQAWAERFRAAADETAKPDAPLVAGPHCRYCAAAATCPALHRHAVTIAQADFAPVIHPPAPHALTPQQVAMVLDHASTIESWLDAVRAHALSLACSGVTVPRHKLVAGKRGARRWVDDADAAAALSAQGVDPYERSVLSPAAIEKRDGKTGKAAVAKVAQLITQSAGNPQLVRESDARPAIAASAVSDFSVTT